MVQPRGQHSDRLGIAESAKASARRRTARAESWGFIRIPRLSRMPLGESEFVGSSPTAWRLAHLGLIVLVLAIEPASCRVK